ncbi:hypothetical protein BDR07DRAFT_1460452 [Suillus spraguei]|nr:hypothetical protein BDR07DRAFT_1460452 [Suillus spraguei]
MVTRRTRNSTQFNEFEERTSMWKKTHLKMPSYSDSSKSLLSTQGKGLQNRSLKIAPAAAVLKSKIVQTGHRRPSVAHTTKNRATRQELKKYPQEQEKKKKKILRIESRAIVNDGRAKLESFGFTDARLLPSTYRNPGPGKEHARQAAQQGQAPTQCVAHCARHTPGQHQESGQPRSTPNTPSEDAVWDTNLPR